MSHRAGEEKGNCCQALREHVLLLHLFSAPKASGRERGLTWADHSDLKELRHYPLPRKRLVPGRAALPRLASAAASPCSCAGPQTSSPCTAAAFLWNPVEKRVQFLVNCLATRRVLEPRHAPQGGLAGTSWVLLLYLRSEHPGVHLLPACLNLSWREGESHAARRPLHVPAEIMKSCPGVKPSTQVERLFHPKL